MASSSQPVDGSIEGEELDEEQEVACESARILYNKGEIEFNEYKEAVSKALSEDFDFVEWTASYWDPYSVAASSH